MDVGLEKRIGASLHMETKENARAPIEYKPSPQDERLADYDLVKSGTSTDGKPKVHSGLRFVQNRQCYPHLSGGCAVVQKSLARSKANSDGYRI